MLKLVPQFEDAYGHPTDEEPRTEWLHDGRGMRLCDDLRFRDSTGRLWIAHSGMVTDGASIPSVLWPIIGGPFEGEHRDGAVLHDAAYGDAPAAEAGYWAATRSEARAAADLMLYEACLARGTAKWRAWAIYRGLRIGGGLAWRAHAQANARLLLPLGGLRG